MVVGQGEIRLDYFRGKLRGYILGLLCSPNSGQGQPTRTNFTISRILYPKPVSSSKVLFLLMFRGSHSSNIFLANSQLLGGKDWLVSGVGWGETLGRDLRTCVPSSRSLFRTMRLSFIPCVFLLWKTPSTCIKISVNFSCVFFCCVQRGGTFFLFQGTKAFRMKGLCPNHMIKFFGCRP